MLIKCGAVDKCIIAYAEDIGAGVPMRISVTSFNSTGLNSGETLLETQNGGFCFPKIRSASYADYDNDGTKEFIISYKEFGTTGSEDIYIDYLDVLLNTTVVIEQTILEDAGTDVSDNTCLNTNLGKLFTSPLVFDMDASPSNGFETAIGFMTDADKFKIHTWASDGNFLDDFPEIEKGEGIIISNAMRATTFTDGDNRDICVVGYDNIDGEIDLLCGSLITSQSPQSNEYTFDISDLHNVTLAYGNWNVHASNAQHSTVLTSGINLNELVVSYGVFEIDQSGAGCGLTGDCSMSLIFENPKPDSVVISVDAEKEGREDLLVMQTDRLWYLDDGFTNTGGNISRYITNPCLDSTWRINTSVEIRVQVTDFDSDQVAAKTILYLDDANEQDSGWTTNQTSGTTFSFSFKANTTIGSGTLRMVGRDTGQPLQNTTLDVSFSVGANGVGFGECETDSGLLITEEDIFTESEIDRQDNALVTGARVISNLFGGIGESVVLLIIMLILVYGIWTNGGERAPVLAFGISLISIFIMLIIGAKLQIIGTGLVVSLILVVLLEIALWTARFLTGMSGNNN